MKFLYVVRDVKAEDVGEQVMVCKADAVAVRAFSDALASNDPRSLMAKYPEDYELVCVGQLYDDGVILTEAAPRVVLTGAVWKAAAESRQAGA